MKDHMKGQFYENLPDWKNYLKEYQYNRRNPSWK